MSKGLLTPIEAVDSLLRGLSRRATPEQADEIEEIRIALEPVRNKADQVTETETSAQAPAEATHS